MYVDGIELLSSSPAKLRKLIKSLKAYCDPWNLSVNLVLIRHGNIVYLSPISLYAKFQLFNSILTYATQVWGFRIFHEVNKVQRYFIQQILHLPENESWLLFFLSKFILKENIFLGKRMESNKESVQYLLEFRKLIYLNLGYKI